MQVTHSFIACSLQTNVRFRFGHQIGQLGKISANRLLGSFIEVMDARILGNLIVAKPGSHHFR